MAPLPVVKNGFSWKFAIALLGGLVLVAQVVLLIVWKWDGFSHSTRLRDFDEFVSLDPREHPHSVEMMVEDPDREHVQEIACNKKTDQCFYVVDGPARWGSGHARSLMVVPLKEMVIAEVGLDQPKGRITDASRLPLLSDEIDMDHAKVIAAQPFIHHTFPSMLQLQREVMPKNLKMLFFGLGGSLPLCNYFSQVFGETAAVTVVEPDPTVEYLAKKWFGIEGEDYKSKVYIDEGTNFLAARPMATPEYDFAVVNDCYYMREESSQCPKKGYARPITAARLREAMTENSTLVINVFSLSNARHLNENINGGHGSSKRQWAEFEHQLLALYNRYFNDTCYYVKVAANMILSCKKTSGIKKDAEPKMTQHKYNDEVQAAGLPVEWQQFVDLDGAKVIQDIEAA